ncbi:GMC oxidoreductase [Pseudonocardia sp. CA-107938]|uniref:GMC oxidoreductase n=1 Tax=Pseudonocardia sp. CA-107938 TaxID=3240021 RepID=UPI003D8DA77D
MTHTHAPADVLIVGGGLMGAAVAQLVRRAQPDAHIVMVDGGSPIGSIPGQHLHDTPEPAIWKRYNAEVQSGIQALYVGAETSPDIGGTVVGAEPGMYHLSAFGEQADAMPASAVAWNLGGMGVHWTAATPWPAGDEVFDHGDPDRWAADLDTARAVLRVHPAPFPLSRPGEAVLATLDALLPSSPGRAPQAMPMAVEPVVPGPMPRTGPNRIFPAIGTGDDPHFELRAGTLAVELLHDGTSCTGARVRDVAGDSEYTEYTVAARSTIVCADTMRTPQLLFASGIRMPALGRYLNEHAFLTGRVLVDLDRFGLTLADLPPRRADEWVADSLWIPHNGAANPFHGQIMNSVFVDDDNAPLAYSFGISLYVPTEIRAENRLVFSETETDAAGLPRITVEFGYSERDLALIDEARVTMRRLAEAFGPFDPESESMLLAPGSSLHYTGTVRMGGTDDGTSVCDAEGRVWGFDNLYVAGNGVVPTALVCNSTLTGMITAVRAARAVARNIESVRVC